MTNPYDQQPFGQPQGGDSQAFPVTGSPGVGGQQAFPTPGGFPPQPGQSYGASGGFPGQQFPSGPLFPGRARVLVPGAQIQFPSSAPLVLATMGSRFLARLIDGFIIGVPFALLGMLWIEATKGEFWVVFPLLSLQMMAMWLYESIMISARGATVGKSVAGLRVVTERTAGIPGTGIGRQAAFARSAMLMLPGVVPCLGHLVVFFMVLSPFFDELAKQGWYDKTARTYVISTKPMY